MGSGEWGVGSGEWEVAGGTGTGVGLRCLDLLYDIRRGKLGATGLQYLGLRASFDAKVKQVHCMF